MPRSKNKKVERVKPGEFVREVKQIAASSIEYMGNERDEAPPMDDDGVPFFDEDNIPPLELLCTEHYIDALCSKPREEVLGIIDKQFQSLIMLSNERSLKTIEIATRHPDPRERDKALMKLKHLQELTQVIVQNRQGMEKSMGLPLMAEINPDHPSKQGVQVMDIQRWETQFITVPGAPAKPKEDAKPN